jgi:hypothetical protein
MTDGQHLQIEIVDDEIVVRLTGTAYAVMYYRRKNDPHLYTKNFPMEVDGRSLTPQAIFLARAWQLAHEKARELGWIV